jgi:hypothetical protein
MKSTQYLLIGISSSALLYFSNLTFSLNTAILFVGIAFGSIILNLDGNTPRRYTNNPIFFWLAYVNYFLVYPICKFIYHKRELKIRDVSNFFPILVLTVPIYLVAGLINSVVSLPFDLVQFAIGMFIGGLFSIFINIGTSIGARPFYPLWKIRFHGKETSKKKYEERQKFLIVIPSVIVIIELFFRFTQSGFYYVIRDFNLIALLLLWAAYLSWSGGMSSFAISNISRKPLNARPVHFGSGLEKINFEEVNKDRRKNGLPLLKFDNSYAELSREHSKTMAKIGKIFHGDNVRSTHGSSSGENVAMTSDRHDVAKALHRQWMTSPGHRANILNPEFRHIGIAIIRKGREYYATQLFSN